MKLISIDLTNVDKEHICCAIGNDKENRARAQTKKEWLRSQFKNGLVFKRLDERGKVFIEYMPLEAAWKPIVGSSYMLINCLWVSGQFKGKGYSTQLLNECISDTQTKGMDGIVVVTSNKVRPFLTDKRFYLKHGFKIIDSALPYFELLSLTFNNESTNPSFSPKARNGLCDNNNGFTFIFSNQCPFMEEYVLLMKEAALEMGYHGQAIKLTTSQEAKSMGSPFGTLGIYYNGKFVTHEPMTKEKFKSFANKVT